MGFENCYVISHIGERVVKKKDAPPYTGQKRTLDREGEVVKELDTKRAIKDSDVFVVSFSGINNKRVRREHLQFSSEHEYPENLEDTQASSSSTIDVTFQNLENTAPVLQAIKSDDATPNKEAEDATATITPIDADDDATSQTAAVAATICCILYVAAADKDAKDLLERFEYTDDGTLLPKCPVALM